MNQSIEDIYCYDVTRGKLVIRECDYPFVYSIESALYRSLFGWSLTVIESLLVAAFWICNIFIERDFTEAYMSLVGLAITMGNGLKLGIIAIQFLCSRGSPFETAAYLGYNLASTTAVMTLLMGMPIFLFMALKVGTKRKQIYSCCTWIPFFMIFVYSFIMNAVYNFVPESIFKILLLFITVPMILSIPISFGIIGLSIPAFTCCSGVRPTMDRLDPVVFDARSRLGWAILFGILVHLPSVAVLYCIVSLTFFLNTTNVLDVFINEEATRIWTFLFPIFCFFLIFLILPSYRDKIMCGCRRQRFVSPVVKIQAAPLPKPPGPNNKNPIIPKQLPVATPLELKIVPSDVECKIPPVFVK